MKLELRVDGADEIKQALRKMGREVQGQVNGALLDGADIIKDEVERRAPQRTGALAGEGFISRRGYVTPYSTNVVVTIAARKFVYAFYQEFGVKSQHVPARPFIRPAFESKKDRANQVVEDRLREIFR